MILVIVGTEQYPFDRLIRSVDRLIEEGVIKEEVLIQMGTSRYKPRHAKFVKFMPFGETYDKIKEASLILAHAGAGTSLLCLQAGRPLILCPRYRRFGEHVDDHQQAFADRMHDTGGVLVAHDHEQLKSAIEHIKQVTLSARATHRPELVSFLHGFAKAIERVNICGVRIHNISQEQAIEAIERLIDARIPSSVVTPNVDHIVKYQNDEEFRHIYQEAALVLCDGMPLLWAGRVLGEPIREKISGSDLFPAVCAVAAKKGWKLFFLGGREGAAAGAARELLKAHPSLRIVGIYSPPFGFSKDAAENARIVGMIKATGPDIVFVGLGAPKQEKWVQSFKDAYAAPVSIGIGVSFEFVAGMVKRAPVWMQWVGLEWLWRLMMEPHRLWRRYLVDDLVFFRLIFDQKFQDIKDRDVPASLRLIFYSTAAFYFVTFLALFLPFNLLESLFREDYIFDYQQMLCCLVAAGIFFVRYLNDRQRNIAFLLLGVGAFYIFAEEFNESLNCCHFFRLQPVLPRFLFFYFFVVPLLNKCFQPVAASFRKLRLPIVSLFLGAFAFINVISLRLLPWNHQGMFDDVFMELKESQIDFLMMSIALWFYFDHRERKKTEVLS